MVDTKTLVEMAASWLDAEIARLTALRRELVPPRRRMTPEREAEVSAKILAGRRRKKRHWTQRPENRERVRAIAARATKAAARTKAANRQPKTRAATGRPAATGNGGGDLPAMVERALRTLGRPAAMGEVLRLVESQGWTTTSDKPSDIVRHALYDMVAAGRLAKQGERAGTKYLLREASE